MSELRGAALIAAAGVGVSIGATTVASKFVVGEVGPTGLTFLRYAIALLCLLPFAALSSWRRLSFADFSAVAALGIGQFALLAGLFHFSLLYIPAGRAAVIFATIPLLTMGLAIALQREPRSLVKALAISACVLGVAVAIGERDILTHPRAWVGDLAAFGAAFTGAVCNVLYGTYTRRHGARAVSALSMAPAVVVLLPVLLLIEGGAPAWGHLTVPVWAIICVTGIASAAGFLLLTWALARAPASDVAAFFSLGPIVATALGVWLLGEVVTLQFLLGVALVSSGLWVALKAK